MSLLFILKFIVSTVYLDIYRLLAFYRIFYTNAHKAGGTAGSNGGGWESTATNSTCPKRPAASTYCQWCPTQRNTSYWAEPYSSGPKSESTSNTSSNGRPYAKWSPSTSSFNEWYATSSDAVARPASHAESSSRCWSYFPSPPDPTTTKTTGSKRTNGTDAGST
jgi:hypothetical protein